MNMTKYEPFGLLRNWHHALNDLMHHDDFFAHPLTALSSDTMWVPAIDITEDSNHYFLHADLPGMSHENIDLIATNNVLTIKGERHENKESEIDGIKRVERHFGRFERRVSLPENAKTDAVSAEYKDGVLKITIPKSEDSSVYQHIPITH